MNINTNQAIELSRNTRSGYLWPRAIILTFILLALFDAYIIKQALSTRVATTTDSPYIDALSYENAVQGKRAVSTDGISMEINKFSEKLVITFHGLQTDTKRRLSLQLLKPNDSKLDKTISLESVNNIFMAENIDLKSGLWLVNAWLSPSVGEGKHYYFESKKFIN